MTEFPYDSALIATAISIAVSVTVLVIRERKIEPEKWKKNVELSTLEKQLEVYGSLVTLLHTFQHKAQREQFKNKPQRPDHFMELPHDIYKLEDIFEKKRYLLSEKLILTYLDIVQKDTYFVLHDSKSNKENKPTTIGLDLRAMQQIAEEEYAGLKKKYDELINI